MKLSNFFVFIAAVSVAFIYSCSSSDSEQSSTEYAYCVFKEMNLCSYGPFTTCQSGGILSNDCPAGMVGASSGSEVGVSSSSEGGASSGSEGGVSSGSEGEVSSSGEGGASSSGEGGASSSSESGASSSSESGASSSSEGGVSSSSSSAAVIQLSSSSALVGTCPVIPEPASEVYFVDPRDSKSYKYKRYYATFLSIKTYNRIWMIDNLNHSKGGTVGYCYGTGDDLGTRGADGPGCNAKNSKGELFGRTYRHSEIENICPEGWEVPTKEEWEDFLSYSSLQYSRIYAGNYNANTDWPPLGWKARGTEGFYWTNSGSNIFAYLYINNNLEYISQMKTNATSNDFFSVRCIASKTVKPKCNGIEYDLETQFCHNGVIYNEAYCGGATYSPLYNPVTHECFNNYRYTKCGDAKYDEYQFCTSCGVYSKCGYGSYAQTYDPSIQKCESNTVLTRCGTGENYHDPETHFCYENDAYLLCNGNAFNPQTQKCQYNTVYTKCETSEKYHIPATQFCFGNNVYSKCGGLEYNPDTHGCSSNTITTRCGTGTNFYNPATQFCVGNGVHSLCGGFTYDVENYYCFGGTEVRPL